MRKFLRCIAVCCCVNSGTVVLGAEHFMIAPFRDANINVQQGWFYHPNMGGGLHRAIDYVNGPVDLSSSWTSFAVTATHGGIATYYTGWNGGLGNYVSLVVTVSGTE